MGSFGLILGKNSQQAGQVRISHGNTITLRMESHPLFDPAKGGSLMIGGHDAGISVTVRSKDTVTSVSTGSKPIVSWRIA